MRSRETGSPACSSNTASSARCRRPLTASARPSARASTGPRTLKSTAPACQTVDRAAGELHKRHTIVLVDSGSFAAGEADARLEKLARAA
jgi:hypothetical protein